MSLVAAFVLAGCLGPDEVDPTGNAPFGRIDSAVAAGTSIRIRGWAIDPNTSAPVQVSVSHLSIGSKHLANVSRPDVALVHPKYGANHGFDITTPSGGKNGDLGQVCLWVENVGAGKDDRILGCRDVRLRSDDATGRFETAKALNSRAIRIAGWALDPETANPVNIRYSVDGNPAVTALARNPRADVNRALNVEGHHGFSIDLSVAVGSHRVCISVIGVGRGKNADLGCKTVVTESVTPVVAGADLKSVSPVGPLPSHPLAGIDRDAGVSTILSDGSVLWLFGDSSGWNENGTIKYFINNTAAWAPKSNPTVTTDGVAPGSEPFQFVFPSKPFTQPCRAGWKSAMWPMSAVTVPKSASEDRVVAFMGNVCMGPGAWQMESRGVSVVEWIYTSTPSPSGNKIAGRVLQQNLFKVGSEYGTAAFYDESGGYIKAYQCGRPADDGEIHWPNDPGFGPCTLARVLPAEVDKPNSWTYWKDGGSWVSDPNQASPMAVPGLPNVGGTLGDKQLPVAAFSIHKDTFSDKFLMTYSPWPGLTSEVMVRSSDSESGPWSSPTKYQLPGCYDSAKGEPRHCYAAIAQPALSTATNIGIGYFDQLIALGPARGGYLAGTVERRP